jgi:hypothetical protein
MSVATRTNNGAALAERLVIGGDLSALKPAERLEYYQWRAGVMGIDWRGAPFDYITTKGIGGLKVALYLNAAGCELLRKKLNITISALEWRIVDSIIEARVTGHTADGRTDMEVGLVSARGVSPADLPDQIAKAITKAKNRLTKSLVGFSSEDDGGPDVEIAHLGPADVEKAHAVYRSGGHMHEPSQARIAEPAPAPAPAAPPVYLSSRLTHEQQVAMFGAAVERGIGGIMPVDTEQEPATQTWEQVIEAAKRASEVRLLPAPVIEPLRDGRISPGKVWHAVLAIPRIDNALERGLRESALNASRQTPLQEEDAS